MGGKTAGQQATTPISLRSLSVAAAGMEGAANSIGSTVSSNCSENGANSLLRKKNRASQRLRSQRPSLFVRQRRRRESQPQNHPILWVETFGKLGIGIEKPELEIREIDPHAIERMVNRGVSLNDLQDTVDDPLIVLQQSRGRVYYLSDKAAVVLNRRGRVITTYSASNFDTKIRALLEHVHK